MLTVDSVTAPINEPHPFCKSTSGVWFDQKHSGAGVVYKVANSILGGGICWVNGPFPAGGYNDWTIFSQYGLKNCLDPGERVEADDGYSGGDPEYTKTRSSAFCNEAASRMRDRIRARHEAVNGKFKAWKILCSPFRHGRTGGRG